MNKYIKTIAVLSVLTLTTSCNLDPEITEYIPQGRHDELVADSDVVNNVAKAALSKTYAIFQEFYRSHDDFGLKAFHIATDLMCEDVAYRNWNWFQFDYQLDNREANYRRTNSTWKQFYKIISNVNKHLETYFQKESSAPAYLASKSEAQALRGIAFFHLVNFYQHTYKGHENDPGVPIVLSTDTVKLPRATVKEVYEQIIKDLTPLVEYGSYTEDRTDVDKGVAAAYLAKAYAQMEDWPNCEKYAAIAKKGADDVVSKPGRTWNIGKATDILWGADVTPSNSSLWASFWSHMDEFLIRGYAAGGKKKLIHNLLYNKISKTDSRRKLWVNLKEYKDIADQVRQSSPNPNAKLEDYDQMKFVAGADGMEQDYSYIRVQDPILLEIEAMVEQNKLTEAATLLNGFVQQRDPQFTAASTSEDLREQVRFQRRIELWGEGTNWFDMKRWKMTIDRTGDGSNHAAIFKVKTDEPKFYHMLPISEIEANPLLKQNTPIK